MTIHHKTKQFLIIVTIATLLSGCGTANKLSPSKNPTTPTPNKTGAVQEKAVAPEKNPVGDIPDTQVFVKYSSAAGGYELKVPEGWARTEKGTDVTLVDKFDGVQVGLSKSTTAPDAKSVRSVQAAALKKTGKAVQINSVKDVETAGGKAVLISYSSNSVPNPVTGKKVRLDNNEYLFYKNGKLATLRLWAPLGADNVDQWKLMSDSFRWK